MLLTKPLYASLYCAIRGVPGVAAERELYWYSVALLVLGALLVLSKAHEPSRRGIPGVAAEREFEFARFKALSTECISS
jgi:hypothetical protein